MTRRWLARVLYENHRTDDAGFALHALVCAMVDDRLSKQRFAVRHIEGMPRNGVDKVLRDCDQRVDKVFPDLPIRARFALLDADKLAPRLGLPKDAPLAKIREWLSAKYPGVNTFTPDAQSTRDSNTEELLRAVAGCLELRSDDPSLVAALDKKGGAMSHRAKIFDQASQLAQRAVRDRLRQAQPSLGIMVDALAELLRAQG